MSRLFSFLHCAPRRARRQASVVECLESRQLLAATPITAAEVELLLNRAAVATNSEDAIIAVVDRGGRILGVRVEQSVITEDKNVNGMLDPGEDKNANGIIDGIDALSNLGNGNGVIDSGTDEERTLVYAIDGAVAKARTAAFFANGTADARINPETGADPAGLQATVGPLTSRTIRNISQTTITQREMQSNPNSAELTVRGPGFVAPVGIGGHFPPAIAHTPQVDLFGIEHTNRDSMIHPGFNATRETTDPTVATDPSLAVLGGDDILLPGRFNVTFDAGKEIEAPESYGFVSGRLPQAQSRGIATLPGGIPIYPNLFADRDGNGTADGEIDVLGGIGVFFPGVRDPDGADPGRIGDATFEQGFDPTKRQTEKQRTNAPKVLEAEYIAFTAAGGGQFGGLGDKDVMGAFADKDRNPIAAVPFLFPFGRIDLVGITLELIGPTAGVSGVRAVQKAGRAIGVGNDTGVNQVVNGMGDLTIAGTAVPEGWLVSPKASAVDPISAADVETIINQGITAAENVRAAIRLKANVSGTRVTTNPGARSRMVLAVADRDGNVLGLYRMHDSTIFSIDVAVAKARNTGYYADPTQLRSVDFVDDNDDGVSDVSIGTAFSNRTFRFLAEPRYPQGVDGTRQGDFSILNDAGFQNDLLKSKNPTTAAGAVNNKFPVPALSTSFVSVVGFDSFNPGTNFRRSAYIAGLPGFDPLLPVFQNLIANQNGIIFFPGSAPIYKAGGLVGGFGISGDGVDQDDVVTFFGAKGFTPPTDTEADDFFVRRTRLPYQKFNRNPFA